MQDVNVVVAFQAHSESMERLALAAAVGAVQGRANIRLRHLQDPAEDNLEYVAPRDTDAAWAEAILVGTNSLSENFERYLGKLKGKIGAPFTAPSIESDAVKAAIERAGLIIVETIPGADALEAARLLGRRVADMARSLRRGNL